MNLESFSELKQEELDSAGCYCLSMVEHSFIVIINLYVLLTNNLMSSIQYDGIASLPLLHPLLLIIPLLLFVLVLFVLLEYIAHLLIYLRSVLVQLL
jgi:hypothetical protein